MKRALELGFVIMLAYGRLLAGTYYVDATAGDDSRNGLSPELAWRSLDRVNAQVFQAGDQLLFRAGIRHSGQLKPQGSGTVVRGETKVIIVRMCGSGSKPHIRADGRHVDAVLLQRHESEYVTLFWMRRRTDPATRFYIPGQVVF